MSLSIVMKPSSLVTRIRWPGILVLVLLLGWIDWQTGYELNFSVFYFIPVGLAGWHLGLGAGVMVSMTAAFVWFAADVLSGHRHSDALYAVWNTMIRLASFLTIGWSMQKIHRLLVSERENAAALRRSLSEIKVLEGLVPICAQCKRIRDSQGLWEQLEVFISERSKATFSHGYCPECAKQFLKDAGLTEE